MGIMIKFILFNSIFINFIKINKILTYHVSNEYFYSFTLYSTELIVISKHCFMVNAGNTNCHSLNEWKWIPNFKCINILRSSCKYQTIFKFLWRKNKIFYRGFSNHTFKIKFEISISLIEFRFFAVKFG